MPTNFSFNDYLVIDTTGSVGIGTTNPQARLYITGSSTANQSEFIVREGVASPTGGAGILDAQNSAGTSILFVSGSGNVGVGTNSPIIALDVYSANPQLRLRGTGTTTETRVISNFGGTALAAIGTVDSNPLMLMTSNTERMRFDTSGNIGIGTSTYTARLFVSGSSTASTPTMIVREGVANPAGGALTFEVENSAGTTILAVSGSGNVGIGISNPVTYKLDVVGQIKSRNQASGDTTGITLGNNGTEKARIQFTASDDSARFKVEMGGANSASERLSIYAGPLGGTATNEALTIRGNGNVGIGTGTLATSRLLITGSGATSSTSTMHLVNSSNTSLLLVRDDGNIGIGTTIPSYPLHVYRSGLADASTNTHLMFDGKFSVAGIDQNDMIGMSSRLENSGGGSQTTFNIGFSYLAGANAILLQPTSGYVGIGTNNPSSKLHVVSGDIRFDNTYGIIGATNTAGHVLRADGTRFVPTQLSYTDLSGTPTVGNATLTVGVSGTGLSISATPTFTANATSNNTITITSNATSSNTVSTLVARDASGDFNAGRINAIIDSSDTRAVTTTPETLARAGVVFDFKTNGTNALTDGGSYHGLMTFRQYGASTDWSGGRSHQLGFTDNDNVWHRSGTSTTWGTWYKFYHTGNLTNPTTGTGTTSYVARWTGTGTLGTGVLYDNATNAGVGTNSPQALLHVGAGGDAPAVSATAYVTAAGTTNLAIRDSTNNVELLNYAYSGGGLIGTATSHSLGIRTANVTALTIDTSQRVGIGTATPGEKLSVHSGGQDRAGLGVSSAVSTLYLGSTTSTEAYRTIEFDRATGKLSFGYGLVGSSLSTAMTIDGSGNVGVGVSTLTARLHVGSVSSTVALKLHHAAASGYGYAQFGDSSTATQNWHIGSEGDGSFRFYNGVWGAGTELMRINSDGNAGIGAANFISRLFVSGSSTSSTPTATFKSGVSSPSGPVVDVQGNTGTTLMHISGSGYTGIGTINAGQLLHLHGGSLLINSTGTGTNSDIYIGRTGGWSSGETHSLNVYYNGPTVGGTTIGGTMEFQYDGTKQNINFRNLFNSGPQTSVLMTIAGTGNVGIGTTDPISSSRFHVSSSLSGNANSGLVVGAQIGGVSFNSFKANTQTWVGATETEYMRLDSSGQVGIGTITPSSKLHVYNGNVTIDNTYGIAWASLTGPTNGTRTSATLDHYEYGTWTPVFAGQTTAGSYTLANTKAHYVRVGKLVVVTLYTEVSAVPSAGSGNWRITGLPYAATGIGNANIGKYVGMAANIATMSGVVEEGQSRVDMYVTTANGTANAQAAIQTYVTTGTKLSMTITYRA